MRLLLWLIALAVCVPLSAADVPYRTDGGDEKLPWFKLQPDEFPPEGSAHAISGELIAVDHVNRAGVIRWDRTDAQRSDEYDQGLSFALLPYGSVSYHGAPAELRDVPIGTHLHGLFYQVEKNGKQTFGKTLRLEDDFSFCAARGRLWRIDKIELNKSTLTVTGIGPQAVPDPKPTALQIGPATRIWKGRGVGALSDLQSDQLVLINLTVCTLKGPGRCTDIWIDAESRAVAAALQLETHRQFVREHGLAARVDEVDNAASIVTLTLFAGFDPALADQFKVNEHVALAVAVETLRTHDQNNDSSRGPIVEKIQMPPGPGDSGVRLRIKVGELLEGHRPKLLLRVWAPGWPIDDLPREERAYDG